MCMYAYIRIRFFICTGTDSCSNTESCIRPSIHPSIHPHIPTYVHTHAHTYIRTFWQQNTQHAARSNISMSLYLRQSYIPKYGTGSGYCQPSSWWHDFPSRRQQYEGRDFWTKELKTWDLFGGGFDADTPPPTSQTRTEIWITPFETQILLTDASGEPNTERYVHGQSASLC